SPEPTNTRPSATTGEDVTGPPVRNFQITFSRLASFPGATPSCCGLPRKSGHAAAAGAWAAEERGPGTQRSWVAAPTKAIEPRRDQRHTEDTQRIAPTTCAFLAPLFMSFVPLWFNIPVLTTRLKPLQVGSPRG